MNWKFINDLLGRIPDNILYVLLVFLVALIGIAILVAFKQKRELALWPPRLGPLPESKSIPTDSSGDIDHSECKDVRIFAQHIDDIIDVYRKRKKEAKELRLMSIAAIGAIKDYSTDESLLSKVICNNCHVKIMFLGPDSDYVRIRAWKDGLCTLDGTPDQTITKIKKTIKNVKLIHTMLNKLLLQNDSSTCYPSVGSLEVRLLDMEPNMTLFISDKKILWGVYTSVQPGHESTVLEVTEQHGKLFNDLERHFDRLWSAHIDRWILRYSQESTAGPELNESIINSLNI